MEKEISANDFIDIVNGIFDDKFGKGGETFLILPNGKIIHCDSGYAYEFWHELISNL